jgi:hypothetical protein
MYHFVPLGTLVIVKQLRLTVLPAILLTSTPCVVAFSSFLQNGPFPGLLPSFAALAAREFQSNARIGK